MHLFCPDSALNSNIPRTRSFGTFKHTFKIDDACTFITDGISVSSIVNSSMKYCYITYMYTHVQLLLGNPSGNHG